MKYANIHNVHMVGIGGIGMSGIAEILLNQGFRVTGSDLSQSDLTQRLESLGANIAIGHSSEHVQNADVVVYSSAVPQDNPELVSATRHGIPCIRRAEMLAELTRLHYCIGIAGTHGKTTTTSMLGVILVQSSYDPTVIVGGKLHAFGDTNARLGKGEFMVVEADEYDRSFLMLNPSIAIITSLEEEHLDIYSDLEDLKTSFSEFANKVPFYGFISMCIDDPVLQDLRPLLSRKVFTYGLSKQADYQASEVQFSKSRSTFTLKISGENAGKVSLNVPGEYNVRNALAAISVAHQIGLPVEAITEALTTYASAYRRFEIKDGANGITVVDDYAHHPTEVSETLKGIRSGWSNRVVCVFQPHTYTRTKEFYKDFAKAFLNTDTLMVMDVYPAREKPIQGVSGKIISDTAEDYGHKDASYCSTVAQLQSLLMQKVEPDDVVIFMGAGDIYKQIDGFIQMWNTRTDN